MKITMDAPEKTGRLATRVSVAAALAGLLAASALSAGCVTTPKVSSSKGSTTAPAMGAHMAGPQQDVYIDPDVLSAKPKPADLSTPESAVRSYLDWVSYGYRISDSTVPKPTMTDNQNVYVDGYVQYNVEQGKLIDQHLLSITFGKVSTTATATILPAHENWKYSYLSIKRGNPVLGGPYTVTYDSTYTLTKTAKGYLVDSIKAMPKGTVK